jgi:hypothetical protein
MLELPKNVVTKQKKSRWPMLDVSSRQVGQLEMPFRHERRRRF